MFIAALFTVVKIWEQPKCPSVNEWIKKQNKTVVHLHSAKLCCSKKKAESLTFCNSMDGPGENYAK